MTTPLAPLPPSLLARIDEYAQSVMIRVLTRESGRDPTAVLEREAAARAALVAECRALVADRERWRWFAEFCVDCGPETMATSRSDMDGFPIETNVFGVTRYDGKTFYGDTPADAVDRAIVAPPPEPVSTESLFDHIGPITDL